MTDSSTLSDLRPGQFALVQSLHNAGGMRRRLQDIGLIENTLVECLGISPLGDPAAFCIRGAVIALRREDSRDVSVRVLPEGR